MLYTVFFAHLPPGTFTRLFPTETALSGSPARAEHPQVPGKSVGFPWQTLPGDEQGARTQDLEALGVQPVVQRQSQMDLERSNPGLGFPLQE